MSLKICLVLYVAAALMLIACCSAFADPVPNTGQIKGYAVCQYGATNNPCQSDVVVNGPTSIDPSTGNTVYAWSAGFSNTYTLGDVTYQFDSVIDYNFAWYIGCPSGLQPNGNLQCSCPDGQQQDPFTSECVTPPSCDVGYSVSWTSNGPICAPDTSNSCPEGQGYYAGLCRDTVSDPSECGSSYNTAIDTGSGYACANNDGCPSDYSPSVYTDSSGSWNVCSPSQSQNSSDSGNSNSSAASSVASQGANSSSGTSSGSGSGAGSSSGTANSSANSSAGSGSGDTGSGTGSAEAADCDSQPQCDGDPVQCAILVQLWINNCQGYSDSPPVDAEADLTAMGNQFSSLIGQSTNVVAGNGVLNALQPANGSGASGDGTGSDNDYGLDQLDSIASQGGSGSCPQDRQINLHLGTFSISYQPLCDLASQLSGLVILIYSYVAMMIVYRAIVNS